MGMKLQTFHDMHLSFFSYITQQLHIFNWLQVSDGMYASVKEPPQLYDVPKEQPMVELGATGGQTYDNKEGQVYDNKGLNNS